MCDHVYRLDSIEPASTPGASRVVWLQCTLCGHRQPRITARSDAEIQAEVDEQP